MKISQVNFCSLFSYDPYGTTQEANDAKAYTYALKDGKSPRIINPFLMPDYVADKLCERITVYPFNSFFKSNTVLVPMPGHAVMQKDSLWVPHQIASVLECRGLGKVSSYLYRWETMRSAHRCLAQNRPTAQEHYDSIATRDVGLFEPEEILLIDDIITQGATAMGCANLLCGVFPKSNIQVFEAVRVMSGSSCFEKFYDPCEGIVRLLSDGKTRRLDH